MAAMIVGELKLNLMSADIHRNTDTIGTPRTLLFFLNVMNREDLLFRKHGSLCRILATRQREQIKGY
jgi:hypothetical protein